jgi:hypothetical protein
MMLVLVGLQVVHAQQPGSDFPFPGERRVEHQDLVVGTDKTLVQVWLDGDQSVRFPDGSEYFNQKEPSGQRRWLWQMVYVTHLVRGLRPGDNPLKLEFFRDFQKIDERMITIHYDPTLRPKPGQALLCASNDQWSCVIDVASGKPIATLVDDVNLCVWSDPTKAIAYDPSTESLVVFDLYQIRAVRTLPNSHKRRPVRFLANGQMLLLDNGDLYDLNKEQIVELPKHPDMAVSPSGRYIAWVDGGFVQLLDRSTGTLTSTKVPQVRVFFVVSVSDDGKIVITSYSYATGHISVVQNGTVTELPDQIDLLGDCVFSGQWAVCSGDGNPLYDVDRDKLFRINMETGQIDLSLNWPGSTLRLTPGGNLLAATSRPAPYAYSFYYRAALFSLPSLSKTGVEIPLPNPLTALSVTGY